MVEDPLAEEMLRGAYEGKTKLHISVRDDHLYFEVTEDKGGSSFLKKAGGGLRPVYRISVRVTGPRNTQAYLQGTVTL